MGLRFDPVGGGQFQQAVAQIIQAERQPIRNLEARKQLEETRLKRFQEFKGKFAELHKQVQEVDSFRKFRDLKVDLGDGKDIAEVTLNKDIAQPGSYSVLVEEMAEKSAMISNGFEDPNAPLLGIGYVVVYDGAGDPFEIFVDYDESSLYGVANKINRTPNSPVQASVIKDMYDPENPWKLIISAKDSGENNQAEFPEFYFLDGMEDFWIEDDKKAKNAYLEVDGFPIEAEANDIPDFLQGVNLHIKQARPERPFTITISEDFEKISGKIQGLIGAINGILEFINKENKVDQNSDTRTTFTGDTGLTNIEWRLRNLMHEAFPAGDPDSENFRIINMNKLGVTFTRDGQLNFDEKVFSNMMEKDFDGVAQAMTGEFGFVNQVKHVLDMYNAPITGLLHEREKGLRARIEQIDNNISNKERALEQRAQSLTQQFARLQASLGSLQSQQQYMSATLGSVGGNPVAQLLG